MILFITLLVMAVPTVCSAWSDSFSPASEAKMKATVCGGIPDFVVLTRHDDWAGTVTEVLPARVDLSPDRSYSEHIRVKEGTDLAQVFPVNSTVLHLHEVYSVETAGPSTWTTAAGTSTFGGSTMIRYGGDWYVQAH